jgi:flagellar biosynthesis GTPase FlhF
MNLTNNHSKHITKTIKGKHQRDESESVKVLPWYRKSSEDPAPDLESKVSLKEKKRLARIKQRKEERRILQEVAKVVKAARNPLPKPKIKMIKNPEPKLDPAADEIGKPKLDEEGPIKETNSKEKKATQQEESSPSPTIPTIEEWKEAINLRKIRPFRIDQLASGQPGEYLMMSGRTGIGKTNMALYLAYCLATGTEFFGHKCRKTKVAYLAFEGSIANYKERISKIEKLFDPVDDRMHF